MTPFTITQEELDSLLLSLSQSERMTLLYGKLKNLVNDAVQQEPDTELIQLVRKLRILPAHFEQQKPLDGNSLAEVKSSLTTASRRVAEISGDYTIVEIATEIQSWLDFIHHNIQAERRRSVRFPASLKATLLAEDQSHPVQLVDISLGGIQFLSPIPVPKSKASLVTFSAATDFNLSVQPVREREVSISQAFKYSIGCVIVNELSRDQLMEIVLFSMKRPPDP